MLLVPIWAAAGVGLLLIAFKLLVTEGLRGREVFPAVAAALKQGISRLAEQLGVPI